MQCILKLASIGLTVLILSSCTTKKNISSMDNQTIIEANKNLAKKWILEGWNQNKNKEIVSEIFAPNWIDGNPTFRCV